MVGPGAPVVDAPLIPRPPAAGLSYTTSLYHGLWREYCGASSPLGAFRSRVGLPRVSPRRTLIFAACWTHRGGAALGDTQSCLHLPRGHAGVVRHFLFTSLVLLIFEGGARRPLICARRRRRRTRAFNQVQRRCACPPLRGLSLASPSCGIQAQGLVAFCRRCSACFFSRHHLQHHALSRGRAF